MTWACKLVEVTKLEVNYRLASRRQRTGLYGHLEALQDLYAWCAAPLCMVAPSSSSNSFRPRQWWGACRDPFIWVEIRLVLAALHRHHMGWSPVRVLTPVEPYSTFLF